MTRVESLRQRELRHQPPLHPVEQLVQPALAVPGAKGRELVQARAAAEVDRHHHRLLLERVHRVVHVPASGERGGVVEDEAFEKRG